MPHHTPPPNGTYRARASDSEHSYEFTFKDGLLSINGTPTTYQFARVANAYHTVLIDGRSVSVVIQPMSPDRYQITLDGRQFQIQVSDEKALLLERFGLQETTEAADRAVHAPMPGLVLNVMVAPGQQVRAGDGLLVLEAMKMENELRAPIDGQVKTLHVAPGDAVGKNALLLEFER